jgi:hypothetical protein
MPVERVLIDATRMELLANYLLRCPAAEKFYNDQDFAWLGTAGSQATAERGYRGPDPSKPWEPRIVSTAYANSRVALTAVSEYAMAIARLITDPPLGPHGILGVEVCCRAAVEIGAHAYWLLDPGISAHDRVCGNLVAQLASSYEAENVGRAMQWRESVRELGISPTTEELRRKYADLGLRVTGRLRENSLAVDGISQPSARSAISDLAAATPYAAYRRIVYNTLSATAHGTLYGLMRMFVSTDEIEDGEPVVERFADHRIIEAAAGLTMTSFIVVLRRAVELMGWNDLKAISLGNMMGHVLATGPR